MREFHEFAGADTGQIAEQMVVSAGDDMLAIVRNIVQRRHFQGMGAAAESPAALQ